MIAEPVRKIDLSRGDLEQLVQQTLDDARSRGADQAEAAVTCNSGLAVTVRLGEVETLEYQRDRGLGVTVFFGHRQGSASTSDLDPEALTDTVAKACTIARHTAEDPFSGLANADRMATSVPDLDLCHPWNLTPQNAIELATECEAAALDLDPRIENSEGAAVSSHQGMRIYGNSHGFMGSQEATGHNLSCVVISRDAGGMERDYWYSVARDASDLEAAGSVGRQAAQRTIERLGAKKISTRKASIIFPAELARGLISNFVSAVSGPAQYRKASFLLDSAGSQVFGDQLSIVERPHLPKAMGSAAFDGEGVATADHDLVSDGVVSGYVLDSYSARKLGLESSGNAGGVHNLLVTSGSLDADSMLRTMDTGFLVRELIGQGVNILTGDYSRGAAGFWVERGQIQYPVSEVTIAGNLRDILAGIREVGTDVDVRGVIRTGSLLIESMTIAGD